MANTSSYDVVLDFLQRNCFTRAEEALKSELSNRGELNGFLQKLTLEEKGFSNKTVKRENEGKVNNDNHGSGSRNSNEAANELIVKEIEYGTERKKRNTTIEDHSKRDLYSLRVAGPSDHYQNDEGRNSENILELPVLEHPKMHTAKATDYGIVDLMCGRKIIFSGEKENSYFGSTSKGNLEPDFEKVKFSTVDSRENSLVNPWSKGDDTINSFSDPWKDCLVRTVFPSASTSYGTTSSEKVKEKKIADGNYPSATVFSLRSDNPKEEFSKLPPVKIKSEDKSLNINWEEKFEHDLPNTMPTSVDSAFVGGSYLDVPIGKEISSSGMKRANDSWLSVSQGIAEDACDMVSGFGTVGDGLSESVEYPDEYWDLDEYEDDNDLGYTRQPIEDETWFLAHEIDNPSDNERAVEHGNVPEQHERKGPTKGEYESFTEEDSYFSGEHYFPSQILESVLASDDPTGLSVTERYNRSNENDLIAQYDGQLMDEEELNLMRAEPVWQGFVTQTNELLMLEDGQDLNETDKTLFDDIYITEDRLSSVRSIGVGINSDAAEICNDAQGSFVIDENTEGDYLCDHDVGTDNSRHSHRDLNKKYADVSKDSYFKSSDSSSVKSFGDDDNPNIARTTKSSLSSSSPRSDYGYTECMKANNEKEEKAGLTIEEDPVAIVEDEEVAAVQEQVKQIKAQEEEFETFNLKIVHRKNRTGFEEDKNYHVALNSVIAGRYHVTEFLGSAAFSKAIQAHDLHTGMDVCIKIIKNNKEFFDQSLDEIKLLKYINKHDPYDKYHILRLYDYFYYREHLLIVCELLKANLYEFQKFNRESGGEVYFTMPRLQSITVQCLESLKFLHGIGLIHCDLKPENILVKSYSRCEVKVIDLGSSCFETDHLCSYVQSRSYRAPEVILGLPYDKKIDIWSLGCILSELCTGNVLFQNDSSATLLARVTGMIRPIDQSMLAKGQDTYKYFTKSHMLYERNQETDRLEYLVPKKTSLRHRLRMGDQGFIDFVAHVLEINPNERPSAAEALKHPWLSYPYEPISS